MGASEGSSNRALRAVPRGPQFPVHHGPPRPPLVGRAEELRALVDLLADHRLITLTGTGGVGKTSLASALAERVVARHGTAALEVPLASVRQVDQVLEAVAGRAGWLVRGSADPFDVLVARIADQPALIVLDNLEHLVAIGPTLVRWIAACPDLRLVVTSRAPLRVEGETVFAVEPLDVPPRSTIITPQAITRSPAVELFVERAREADPSFRLSDSNAADVAKICQRLDGLPLAIELAAARLDLLGPRDLAGLIERRPDVLRSRQRALADERHRTLQATIAWSYDLLDPELRRVFRTLAVFVGGFRLDALTTVAGLDPVAALDALGELIDHGLVRRVRDDARAEGSSRRYGCFEMIREFALGELTAAGELAAASAAHAGWCVELVRATASKLTGDDPGAAMAELSADIDNLREAMRWALERRDAATALAIGSGLWHFWWFRGASAEGRAWLDEAFAIDAEIEPGLLASSWNARAQLAVESGDAAGSIADFERAASMFADLGRPAELATTWNGMAFARRSLGDLDAAAELHERVLSLEDRSAPGVLRARAVAENGLAAVAYFRNEMATAARRWEAAYTALRDLGDRRGTSQALSNLGAARLSLGDVAGATAAHQEAADIARSIGDTYGLLYALVNVTEDHLAAGELDRARASLVEVTELADHCGDRYVRAATRVSAGQLALRQAQPAEAFHELGAALASYRTLGADLDLALTLELLGLVAATAALVEAAGFFRLADGIREATSSSAPEQHRAALEAARQRAATCRGESLPLSDLDEAEAAARVLARRVVSSPAPDSSRSAGDAGPDLGTAAWAATGLSRREAEVALLVARRATDPEIAAELFISTRTASSHVSSVLRKLGLRSRRLVARELSDRGLLPPGR